MIDRQLMPHNLPLSSYSEDGYDEDSRLCTAGENIREKNLESPQASEEDTEKKVRSLGNPLILIRGKRRRRTVCPEESMTQIR